MRECPFGGDGNYSDDRFAEVYNAELANNLGNLYSRTLSMCARYFAGRLEGSAQIDKAAWRSGLKVAELVRELRALIKTFQYNVALQRIWLDVLDSANRYIQTTEPFKLIKTDPVACKAALVNLAEAVRAIAILIKPFLPGTAETFYRAFNFEEGQAWNAVSYDDLLNPPALELRVTADLPGGKPKPLFPKIEMKEEAES
jgi:methionyl-tRNA synthetase